MHNYIIIIYYTCILKFKVTSLTFNTPISKSPTSVPISKQLPVSPSLSCDSTFAPPFTKVMIASALPEQIILK